MGHPIIKTGDKPYTVGWKKVGGKWKPIFTKKKTKRKDRAKERASYEAEMERLRQFDRAVANDVDYENLPF